MFSSQSLKIKKCRISFLDFHININIAKKRDRISSLLEVTSSAETLWKPDFFYSFDYISENDLFAKNTYHLILAGSTQMSHFYSREPLSVLSTQDNSFVVLSDASESFPIFNFHYFSCRNSPFPLQARPYLPWKWMVLAITSKIFRYLLHLSR